MNSKTGVPHVLVSRNLRTITMVRLKKDGISDAPSISGGGWF